MLCVPGATFGPGLDRYLRFAFANLDAALMPSLVQRLLECQDAGPESVISAV